MIYLLFALCILGLDLFVKKRVETLEDAAFPLVLAGGFTLEKHHNYGFVLNRFDRHPKLVRFICLLIFLPLFFRSLRAFLEKEPSAPGKALGRFGAACLVGGAASNLYDRFFRGYVVDYLRVPDRFRCMKKIRHVIFNIADFFIFLGGICTAIYGLFTE